MAGSENENTTLKACENPDTAVAEGKDNIFWVAYKKVKDICYMCHSKLMSKCSSIVKRNGTERSIMNKQCADCGTKHISGGTNIMATSSTEVNVINSNDLAQYAAMRDEQIERYKKRKVVQKEKYAPYATHTSERTPIEYEKTTESPNINYCMCVVRDTAKGQTYKVTITNGSEIVIASSGERFYPSGTTFGTACLIAVANEKKSFEHEGNTYYVIRYVRYDAVYVDSYESKDTQEKQKAEKKGTSAKGNDSIFTTKNREVDARNDVKDVFVYDKLNNASCVVNKHDIESVTLITKSLIDAREIRINAYCCKQCAKYFVNNDAVKELLTARKYPVVRFHIVGELYGDLRSESELTMYGYNVKAGGMSDAQRQSLLAKIIDQGLIAKYDIIRMLQFNIDFIGKKANMDRAKSKWSDDIRFVSSYTKGNSKVIQGNLRRL